MRTTFFSTTHRISATSLWISRHELKPSPQDVQESRSLSHWIYICCKVINVFVSDVATDLLLTMWVTKTSLLTHFIPKLKHSLSKHYICGKLELFYNKNVSVLHLLIYSCCYSVLQETTIVLQEILSSFGLHLQIVTWCVDLKTPQ